MRQDAGGWMNGGYLPVKKYAGIFFRKAGVADRRCMQWVWMLGG